MLIYWAVKGCSYCDQKRSRWQQEECGIHDVFHHNVECTCDPPLKKIEFPSKVFNLRYLHFSGSQITLKDFKNVIFYILVTNRNPMYGLN